jgi:hypothetical protein
VYKAQHQPSGQEIIILDPRWRPQVDYLRSLDQQDALVCPGCQQPVRVRAGITRRWHFAHKHLQNCPFERESPTLLAARAALYEWLVDKFAPELVTLEKTPDGAALPRHVDCWVAQGAQIFAYWIFDRRMPPGERASLQAGFDELGVPVHWVFVTDLLRVDQDLIQDRLHLTTTERAFMQASEFDRAWQTHFEHFGKSLHYLDADQETLTTFRNLEVIHLPQLYAGARLTYPLSEVLVSTQTGEFVHPGEVERLQQRRQEIELQEQKAAQRLQQAQDFFRGKPLSKATTLPQEKPTPTQQPFERVGTCRVCGAETTDWITYFGQTQECICRACAGKVKP